jgi:lipoprotein NlpI
MSFSLTARAITALFLLAFVIASEARAQTAPANVPFKEVQVGASEFTLADPIPSWVEPVDVPESDKTAPLVLRLADTQFMVKETPTLFVRLAMRVSDAGALGAAGQLALPFIPQYQHPHLHYVRILRGPDTLDRTSTSSIRFLQREMGLERGMYSGEVTASVLVNDVRVGDTIEYSYSLDGQNPVFGGAFADSASWDQTVPTTLRRVVLNFPETRHITWRMIGDGQAKPIVPVESTRAGVRQLRFEEHSIAEIISEPYTPSDYMAFRMLQFSEYAGWDEVVAWADKLFHFDGGHDGEFNAIVQRLRGLATDEERVTAALEFVQSEIRYFSASLGESSHRPALPDVVLGRRYGDCKDKSFLLMSLLSAVGIETHPVLLKIGRRGGMEKLLPSPRLFDHAIVQAKVDGNVYYLDPTRLGQQGRPGRMGQAHEGAQVLVIAPGVNELSTIATPGIDDLVRHDMTETASFPKFGGDAELQVHEVVTGLFAEALRLASERLPRARLLKIFADAQETRYPGTRMIGEPEIKDDRINNVLSVTSSYIVPKLATEKDGSWYVRFVPTNLSGTLVIPQSSVRSAPFAITRFPFNAHYTFEVKFPEEVSALSDPGATSIDDKYFAANVSLAFRGNLAKTTVDLSTLSRQVAAQDIGTYSEDLRTLNTAIGGSIFVSKSAIRSASLTDSDPKTFAESIRHRVLEGIDKAAEVINSGKLSGKDLAAAHCMRSDNYADLGQFDDAMREASEALKITPNGSRAFACRAYRDFAAGEFDRSVADYSRAITLGATDAFAFHMRGVANFYAGQIDDAADDFAHASALDKAGFVYNDLWLSWTFQRLGRPTPEVIAKRAAKEAHGDWPRPALAMLNGALTPDEMLALLDQKSGDDRQMALAEGYFYLGQHHLLLGNKDLAREYFEKVRQLNVILYTEHHAAKFELQRLKEFN